MDVKVLTPKEAEYLAIMPEKEVADTSNMLLCPMPGLIVSIHVSQGDEVQEGQALATLNTITRQSGPPQKTHREQERLF